jgi:hypothetical protein
MDTVRRMYNAVFGPGTPAPRPIGTNTVAADMGTGADPIGNFNVSALARHKGTPDEEPWLDYFTGKMPWTFALNADLADAQHWRDGPPQHRLERRHPTQEELAVLNTALQAIRRNPLARYGFDPQRVVLMPGANKTTAAGLYDPPTDYQYVALDPNAKQFGTLAHESMHAGVRRLLKAGGRKVDPRDEETLVRFLMQKYAGDTEKSTRPEKYSKQLEDIAKQDPSKNSWYRLAQEVNTDALARYRDFMARVAETTQPTAYDSQPQPTRSSRVGGPPVDKKEN